MISQPWWATWWGRLLGRLGLTLLSEAESLAQAKNRWQSEISDALDLTMEDHGRWHATVEQAVTEINLLKSLDVRAVELRNYATDVIRRHQPIPTEGTFSKCLWCGHIWMCDGPLGGCDEFVKAAEALGFTSTEEARIAWPHTT